MTSVVRVLLAVVHHPRAALVRELLDRLQSCPPPQAKAAYAEWEVWHTSAETILDLVDRLVAQREIPVDVLAGLYAIRDLPPRTLDYLWLLARTCNTDGRMTPVFRPERAAAASLRSWFSREGEAGGWRSVHVRHATLLEARRSALAAEIKEVWRKVRPVLEARIEAFQEAIFEDRDRGSWMT